MSFMYRIRIKSQLDPYWSHWFDEMVLTQAEHDETELTGPVEDQEALHRLLEKIRDLNLGLISVERIDG